MNFLPSEIEKYIEAHTSAEPEALKNLNRETHAKIYMPQMLSGHLQGRFLKMLCSMINPKCILEIGTFTGYSSLCLAEGMQAGGILHTIDVNEELTSMVKKHIKEAGAEDKIKVHVGNALDIIPTIQETFDLVFIDADKNNYVNYFNLVFDKVRKGGYIMADNVLWSGKVIEKSTKKDDDTKTLIAYNDMVVNDKRVESVLVPIRDGIMISRKIV